MRRVFSSLADRHFQVDQMVPQMLRGVFDHYFEKLLLAYWGHERMRRFLLNRVRPVHQDLLDEALARGKGVILTTAHFGAVEFLPGSLSVRSYPVTALVRFQTARLKRTVEQRASLVGTELLDVEEGAVLPRSLGALKRGRVLVFELDEMENWRPSAGKEMNFFGRRVRLDRTVEILQRRSGAPLLLGLMERRAGWSYELVFESPCEHFPAPIGLGPDAQLLKRLEHYIYDRPGQWYIWNEVGSLGSLRAS